LSYASRYNQSFGLPENTLSAIASVESGRKKHKTSNYKTPWPWTINVSGNGYFFKTRTSAIRKVKELRRKGISNIDVGCMQINLYYHPKAFSSLKEAFNPNTNVLYAANFLSKLYKQEGNWSKAISRYHSGKKERGQKYLQKVIQTAKIMP